MFAHPPGAHYFNWPRRDAERSQNRGGRDARRGGGGVRHASRRSRSQLCVQRDVPADASKAWHTYAGLIRDTAHTDFIILAGLALLVSGSCLCVFTVVAATQVRESSD